MKWLNKTNLIKICQNTFPRHRLLIWNPLCYPEALLSTARRLNFVVNLLDHNCRSKDWFADLDNKYRQEKQKGDWKDCCWAYKATNLSLGKQFGVGSHPGNCWPGAQFPQHGISLPDQVRSPSFHSSSCIGRTAQANSKGDWKLSGKKRDKKIWLGEEKDSKNMESQGRASSWVFLASLLRRSNSLVWWPGSGGNCCVVQKINWCPFLRKFFRNLFHHTGSCYFAFRRFNMWCKIK